MFKITKDDLAKKTDVQLTALFQEATNGLNGTGSSLTSAKARPAFSQRECNISRIVSRNFATSAACGAS